MTNLETRRIRTVDTAAPDGTPDGSFAKLLTEMVGQVALVTIAPRTFQGWYMHGDRDEWHACISGRLLVAQAGAGAEASGPGARRAILVPRLVAHGLYNPTDEEALVVIASDHPWLPGEDDWPLTVHEADLERLALLWREYFP